MLWIGNKFFSNPTFQKIFRIRSYFLNLINFFLFVKSADTHLSVLGSGIDSFALCIFVMFSWNQYLNINKR